jgi:hypothetical protein
MELEFHNRRILRKVVALGWGIRHRTRHHTHRHTHRHSRHRRSLSPLRSSYDASTSEQLKPVAPCFQHLHQCCQQQQWRQHQQRQLLHQKLLIQQ